MRPVVALLTLSLLIPFVAADGHVDDAAGTTEGPLPVARPSEYGCNDLAADVRALDVRATEETLTLEMTLWDGDALPTCSGVAIPRSRLDHSMLVRSGSNHSPFEVRFDLSEFAPTLSAVRTEACGSFHFIGAWTGSDGQFHVGNVQTACLPGVVRSGDATTFTVPIHGSVSTSNGAVDYDFRGSVNGWTLGYTHSFVAGQLFAQDWVVGSSNT